MGALPGIEPVTATNAVQRLPDPYMITQRAAVSKDPHLVDVGLAALPKWQPDPFTQLLTHTEQSGINVPTGQTTERT